MKRLLNLTLMLGLFSLAQAQTLCESGLAGTFPCDNIDLMTFMPLSDFPGSPSSANDIWGWTDPLDSKEYALLGLRNGMHCVDITDPLNPIILGYVPTETSNSTWRDIKVYNNHAFIVSEAGSHGMQVFDLTRLRNVAAPPETFTTDALFTDFGDCHNIAINETTGKAYAVGTGIFSGGLVIIDITNPIVPVLVGDYALDGYTHDCQVVLYNGPDADYIGREIAFNCNGNSLTIADVNDPTDTQTISVSTYTNSAYAHQGWLTEDHRYFLLGDELDENNGNVTSTTTYIWNVEDLDNPFLAGTYEGPSNAIDHNLYVRSNLVYQSNYTAGIRILDAQNVASAILTEVAFFDLHPASDNTSFSGSWSNYPYFESGIVPATHYGEGMYILRPRLINSDQASQSPCETDNVVFDLNLEAGWIGPVTLSASNLPAGVTASFSSNGVTPPTTVQMTLSGLQGAGGVAFDTKITGAGLYYDYDVSVETVPQLSTTYYADTDSDGFGSASSVIQDCVQPAGYVTDDTDCDDSRDDVYPGAPGTAEGIDNDCNGLVEGDEELLFCPEDLNQDGIINATDLLIFLAAFGCDTPPCVADFDDNGITNAADLLTFLAAWGTFCP